MTTTTYDAALPVHFETTPLNPSPTGLFAATDWVPPDSDGAEARPLVAGVEVRGINFGGEEAFGVWGAPWCGMITTITLTDASGGTFDVDVDGQTATVAYDVTGGALQTAVVGLSTVGTGGVTISNPEGGSYVLTFKRSHTVSVDGDDLTGGGDLGIGIEDEMKRGERPAILDPFDAWTVWGYDECDLFPQTRRDVETRAQQILRMEEQTAIERQFAIRMLLDANDIQTPFDTVGDLTLAIGYLEAHLAMHGTVGFIHLGAQWAAVAATSQLITKSGTKLTTPLGHTLVFGGGYVDTLEDQIVATSQPYGWRNEPTVRTAIDQTRNRYFAIAERTVTIGYEAVLAAVEID